VDRCEHWPWSSIALRAQPLHALLDALPVALPGEWITLVNLPQAAREVASLKRRLRKNRPGDTVSTPHQDAERSGDEAHESYGYAD
jgi:hypothetical protein